MAMVVLSLHLLVCICLIGLVLLQRSEGGALGMGGGGGGALMSGRGAADALAKMTTFAGGFFLCTSLGLTVLSGAASNSNSRSVLDSAPIFAPFTQPAAPAPATTDETTRPDPVEGAAEATTQLAASPQITLAPSPAAASTRAGPVTAPPSQAAAHPLPASTTTNNAAAPRTTNASGQTNAATTRPPAGAAVTANRNSGATTQAASNNAPATTTRPLVIPNTSGAALTLGDDQLQPEIPLTQEPVRRERQGPDQ